MKIITVIQARLASTRLPGKVLMDMGDGRTMIEWVVERAERIGYPVVVAVPDIADDLRTFVWRYLFSHIGSEQDVLLRLVGAARMWGADHVIRVTADCPFLDVEAARWTVDHHLATGADFTHYIAEGRGVEVFTREALERSDRESAASPEESWALRNSGDFTRFRSRQWYREHPDEWILNHPDRFHVETVKFSVDTPADLERARVRAKGANMAPKVNPVPEHQPPPTAINKNQGGISSPDSAGLPYAVDGHRSTLNPWDPGHPDCTPKGA